jgi:NADH dehydrogenase
MKVLILGGTGFIGSHAARALRARGHQVLVGTRHPRKALAKLPPDLRDCDLRETHLESLTTHYVWKPLLKDVDAVLNAAGLLRERGSETYDRVHHMAPRGLAMACERLGVRLVHVSALGLRRESRNHCLRSKLLGERVIMETGADYSIVRPSLLDGEGGHAAGWLRRAAQWPLHLYPSDAKGRMAALDVRDLGEALAVLCEARNNKAWGEVELGGSARRTMAEHLDALRGGQESTSGRGTPRHPALRLPVPAPLARLAAEICDFLHLTPLSAAGLELLRRDNLPRANLLPALLGRAPMPVGREPVYAPTAMPMGHETPVPPSPQ